MRYPCTSYTQNPSCFHCKSCWRTDPRKRRISHIFFSSISVIFSRMIQHVCGVCRNVYQIIWCYLGIECFHSNGQHSYKFFGTKESVCIRKEFNTHNIGLVHKRGRRFINFLDVMWKRSTYLWLVLNILEGFSYLLDWTGFNYLKERLSEEY